uniref:DUF58 domain-containing protein n=1 Tax=Ningiella ruwaisensis TaxID=2364274 RepID=UPI00109FD0E7|nr:DUF58 domain-containing protein [Ningiella ruwaisensis]
MKSIISSINRLRNTALIRRNHWLDKRIPAENTSQFNMSNTFIFPSSFGWAMIAMVLFLFILGTNYQNNVVLGMSYFFTAVLLLSLFHSYQYFTQHKIHFKAFEPDFENREIALNCELSSLQRYPGGEFIITAYNRSIQVPLKEKFKKAPASIMLPKMQRGYHVCKRVKVECFFAFGLYRCWSYLQPKHRILVYPSVLKAPLKLHQINEDDDNDLAQHTRLTQSDNLQGIRNYVETDPMHHVSWKHVAKGQGLLTKDFAEHAGLMGWLKLSDYGSADIEQSLRILSYQVQHLSQEQIEFGLDLGDTKILPNSGIPHLEKCLFQLATYGQPKLDRRASDAKA